MARRQPGEHNRPEAWVEKNGGTRQTKRSDRGPGPGNYLSGTTVNQLAEIFGMRDETVYRRIAGIEPSGTGRNGAAIYKISDVAPRLLVGWQEDVEVSENALTADFDPAQKAGRRWRSGRSHSGAISIRDARNPYAQKP